LAFLAELDATTKEDLQSFVGAKYESSYKKRWYGMSDRRSKLSWNWACFFFGPFWMSYRKMYRLSYGYLAAYFILELIVNIIGDELSAIGLVDMIIWLGLTVFVNYFYLEKAKKAVASQKNVSTEKRKKELSQLGGTSVAAVFVYVLATIILGSVVQILI